jgi:hypothetical protein
MATFKTTRKDFIKVVIEDEPFSLIKKERFKEFNESILGLGKINTKPSKIDALSAIFDLERFTNFCTQRDPDLNVSLFLNDFLIWIFDEIKKSLIVEEYNEGYLLYSNLPFLSKYLGDGILFLWDAAKMDEIEICNTIITLM